MGLYDSVEWAAAAVTLPDWPLMDVWVRDVFRTEEWQTKDLGRGMLQWQVVPGEGDELGWLRRDGALAYEYTGLVDVYTSNAHASGSLEFCHRLVRPGGRVVWTRTAGDVPTDWGVCITQGPTYLSLSYKLTVLRGEVVGIESDHSFYEPQSEGPALLRRWLPRGLE